EIVKIDRVGLGAGVFMFAYDGDGRCIQDDRHTYSYNALGQLVEVKALPGLNTILTQTFDPAGRVLSRVENGNAYNQLSIGYRVVERQTPAGVSNVQFTHGLGVDEVVMESAGANNYPLQDASSSILAYTDARAAVSERYLYSPFGDLSIWAPDGI